MAVTRREVEHVAKLARLQLEPGEIERLTHELNDILAHVADLESAELEGHEELAATDTELKPLRADDGVPDALEIEPAAFAPAWAEEFFTLPRLEALGGNETP